MPAATTSVTAFANRLDVVTPEGNPYSWLDSG